MKDYTGLGVGQTVLVIQGHYEGLHWTRCRGRQCWRYRGTMKDYTGLGVGADCAGDTGAL